MTRTHGTERLGVKAEGSDVMSYSVRFNTIIFSINSLSKGGMADRQGLINEGKGKQERRD